MADPYRWLEDPGSDDTRAWLAGQDALYAEQLAATPGGERALIDPMQIDPAVLFTVSDSDTRVDPLHARKMCAALQHASPAHRAAVPSCAGCQRRVRP